MIPISTVDEAIEHAKKFAEMCEKARYEYETVDKNFAENNRILAHNQRMLTKWLTEYKQILDDNHSDIAKQMQLDRFSSDHIYKDTLDDAIQRENAIVDHILEKENFIPITQEELAKADRHRQLSIWLTDYKRLLEYYDDCVTKKSVIDIIDEECKKVPKEEVIKILPIRIRVKELLPCLRSIKIKAKWIEVSEDKLYKCSVCKQLFSTDYIEKHKYCHGCGSYTGGRVEPKRSLNC